MCDIDVLAGTGAILRLRFHGAGRLDRVPRLRRAVAARPAIYFIDRKPVSDIRVPDAFEDPIYMIVNPAMGWKNFEDVDFVDAESPVTVAFEIDRVSAWQIDP